VNRNAIPFDTERPFVTSGIRIGTPAITTRGFVENDVKQVVHWIHEVIKKRNDEAFLKGLREIVKRYCTKFPLYEK